MTGTIDALADLSPVELEQLRRLKDAERARLKPEQAKARTTWIEARVESAVKDGVAPKVARKAAERAIDGGVLLPSFLFDFDQLEFVGATVCDVLADYEKYVGQTLADPNEGRTYGRGKAMIMQRPDGSLWVHSFAHGRTTYDLKYDADGLRAVLAALPDEQVIPQFVRLTRRTAEIDGITEIQIRHQLMVRLKRTLDIGKLEFKAQEKAAHEAEDSEDARRRAEERQQRRIAAGDTRPQHPVPPENAPLHEVTEQLNAVFSISDAPEPPMRDVDGFLTVALPRRVVGMHLLTTASANAEEAVEQPPPEQVLLTKLSVLEVAHKVEGLIDYITPKEGASVRLPMIFIRDFSQQRIEDRLPIVQSIAAMPIVVGGGRLLSGHRLDRDLRILFRVSETLEARLPQLADCTPDAIAAAVHFLTDDWLVDVPCTYVDKLKLLALGGTILQRGILPARPGFFITAGRRSTGKTTVAHMIGIAATGQPVSASAWSTLVEERRKSILAYLGEGVPMIVWDNIKRGMTIACPHIEKALTTAIYTDRILGVSEFRSVPANTVHCWTGNNIGPRGDTASRSLVSRLEATRSDPENREFTHIDPLAWTYSHREQILGAYYCILRGNPQLIGATAQPPQTRFKVWWHFVGSAFEYAAACHHDRPELSMVACPPERFTFKEQFLANDADDEHDHALAIVLRMLQAKWPGTFTAGDILAWTHGSNTFNQAVDAWGKEFFEALEAATERTPQNSYSIRSLTWRLRAVIDAPTQVGDKVMCLRIKPGRPQQNEAGAYTVEILK